MDNKLVSFIIISYNHEKFIDDCMQAVLNQTYNSMEILYMDDASEDHSYIIAERYKKELQNKFKRVEFYQNKDNQGVVRNLNTLIPKCKGDYIKFLAADDFMLSTGIEDMVECLEQHPEVAMVYTNGVCGDENTRYQVDIPYWRMERIYSELSPSGDQLFFQLYERDFISAPAVMLRRSTYTQIGLYDENMAVEDWDCYIRVALCGEIIYLDKCTVMYRILQTSLSHSASFKRRIAMKKSELLLLEKYKDYVPDGGKERIARSYNEAVSDACHIGNRDYMEFLKAYGKRNEIHLSARNHMKYLLYKCGGFRLLGRNK